MNITSNLERSIMRLSEILQDNKPDPAVEAKKRQLQMLKRQLEAANKQMETFKKTGKENPSLEKRIEVLKDKIHKLKETMVDALDVQD